MSGRFGSRPYIQNTNATVATIEQQAREPEDREPLDRRHPAATRLVGRRRLAGRVRLVLAFACGGLAGLRRRRGRLLLGRIPHPDRRARGHGHGVVQGRYRGGREPARRAPGFSPGWVRFATAPRVRRDTTAYASVRASDPDGAADLEREPPRPEQRASRLGEIAGAPITARRRGGDPAHRQADGDAQVEALGEPEHRHAERAVARRDRLRRDRPSCSLPNATAIGEPTSTSSIDTGAPGSVANTRKPRAWSASTAATGSGQRRDRSTCARPA